MEQKIIPILDAGHGGMVNGCYATPGKRSPVWKDGTQYFEGVGNREIRRMLCEMLTKAGIKFYNVADSENDIPLQNRVTQANNLSIKEGIGKCIYISIHSDAAENPQANGWSVYTSQGQTKSDVYAQALYEEAVKMWPGKKMRVDFTDKDADKEENFYVLKNTNCPAILSENFFMTNEKECAFLMSHDGKKQIAQIHFDMIMKFV